MVSNNQKGLLSPKEAEAVTKAMIKLYPSSQSDLDYNNHFELLCAVVLSAQTTDAAVNKVTPALFETYPGPEEMAQSDLSDLEDKINKIGLYRNKAKFLKKLSQQLLDYFDGKVPDNREDLMSLTGVGRKTANVVMSVGFNKPAFAVDTHIMRMARTFKFAPAEAKEREIEDVMMAKIPEEMWVQGHLSILHFGRYQCVARKHNHDECVQLIYDNLETEIDTDLS